VLTIGSTIPPQLNNESAGYGLIRRRQYPGGNYEGTTCNQKKGEQKRDTSEAGAGEKKKRQARQTTALSTHTKAFSH
jgi:hypothetical protein